MFPESWGHEKHFFKGLQEEGSDTTEISLILLIWISIVELWFCHRSLILWGFLDSFELMCDMLGDFCMCVSFIKCLVV
jgi:hypothetical protein